MRTSTWTGLAFSTALLLGSAAPRTAADGTDDAIAVLDIIGPDQGDCPLGLSWRWGSMTVKHVWFDDHRGPFKAVVESSGKEVRVTIDGWGNERFVASAETQIRIIYKPVGRKAIEFTMESSAAGEVRVRRVDRPDVRGKRVVLELGEVETQELAKVSAEGGAKH